MTSRQPAAKNTTIMRTFSAPVLVALRREQLLEEADRPDRAQAPDDPAGEEHQRHRQRQVDVGVGAAEERFLEPEALGRLVSPADRADARESGPTQLAARMKMKTLAKNQNVCRDQMRADEAFEEAVEALDQPLEEVLRAVRAPLSCSGSPPARRR